MKLSRKGVSSKRVKAVLSRSKLRCGGTGTHSAGPRASALYMLLLWKDDLPASCWHSVKQQAESG